MKKILFRLYGCNNQRVRNIILIIIKKIEKGELFSPTLRQIFKYYHKVEIGMYTHGGCFVPFQVAPYTTIGRYCSFALNMRILNADHPVDFKSTHAFFFNSYFKCIKNDIFKFTPLRVGNDVWIGHNAIILPHVKNIGDGAVIGAGAVINNDVPPYAIVLGNPARVVRYRFSKKHIEKLLDSSWWEKSIEEITRNIHDFIKPYEVIEN